MRTSLRCSRTNNILYKMWSKRMQTMQLIKTSSVNPRRKAIQNMRQMWLHNIQLPIQKRKRKQHISNKIRIRKNRPAKRTLKNKTNLTRNIKTKNRKNKSTKTRVNLRRRNAFRIRIYSIKTNPARFRNKLTRYRIKNKWKISNIAVDLAGNQINEKLI